DPSGGLLVRAPDRRKCAELLLAEDSASLLALRCATVALPWAAYGSMDRIGDGPAPDAWFVTQYTVGRRGAFGISVAVSGRLDADARSMYGATPTLWRRLDLSFNSVTGSTDRHFIPLLTSAFGLCERER